MQEELNFDNVFIQLVNDKIFDAANISVHVLRLDKIHCIISGNKWFKLKYYLQEATGKDYSAIATFGGAFSNHILATAYACNKLNLQCTGFIRGEQPKQYSQTLLDARALNMKLEFVSRLMYKNKQLVISQNPFQYFIPEGGYGETGAKGAEEILQLIPQREKYNYIVCAAGTGTMLAGIANAALPHQQCIGVCVTKNNFSLENEVSVLLKKEAYSHTHILHDYHFGGYAKYTNPLLDFINKNWRMHRLPLDFVYTAKAFYAVCNLAEKKIFPEGSKIIFIHSGGLQGNRSLPSLFIEQ